MKLIAIPYSQAFPSDGSILTAANCVVVVTLTHIREVVVSLVGCLDLIEKMLRNQLIAAIGKEVQN